MELSGRPLVPGTADGPFLFADEPLSFWGGYDAETGAIIDRRHALAGANGSGRVLAIPATRGSSTTTAVLLEAVRAGTAPAALLIRGTDTFLALAATVARELYGRSPAIVSLDAGSFERTGAWVRDETGGGVPHAAVDALGRVRLYRR